MRRRYRLRGALCGAVLFALTSSGGGGGHVSGEPVLVGHEHGCARRTFGCDARYQGDRSVGASPVCEVSRPAFGHRRKRRTEGERRSRVRCAGRDAVRVRSLDRQGPASGLPICASDVGRGAECGAVPILNVRSNEGCPKRVVRRRKRLSSRARREWGDPNRPARDVCPGARKTSCSSRNSNFVRPPLELLIETWHPQRSLSTPVRAARARGIGRPGRTSISTIGDRQRGSRQDHRSHRPAVAGWQTRPCRPADNGVFDGLQPCVDGAGQIDVDTTRTSDGTHELVVHAQDVAGNSPLRKSWRHASTTRRLSESTLRHRRERLAQPL